MTDTHGKSVPALPKIKRQSNKGGLRKVESNSRDAQEVKLTIERSNLDRTYQSPWTPRTIQMVVNKEQEAQYREKKTAMKEEGRPARELQDHFAFILVKDPSVMTKIAQQGVKTKPIAFNALGDSKLGIYVCKHADVQLKLAESWKVNECHLIVCKVMYGKCKMVTAQNQTGAAMEPTPNFDCHMSQEKPNPNDPFNMQITKSMVFLYEYNEDYETVDRPRHCVPYAFVVYNKSKDAKSSGDTKPVQWTSKSKPQTISRQPSSGNEAIRKSNREAFEKRVAGLYQAPQFPRLYIPPMENWMPAQTGLLPLPVRPPSYSVMQTRQDPRIRSTNLDNADTAPLGEVSNQTEAEPFGEVSMQGKTESMLELLDKDKTEPIPKEEISHTRNIIPSNNEPVQTKEENEMDIVPYSPGINHGELDESFSDSIPTPERELEESIIKASFRKDAKTSEQSAEKEEVNLAMLNANSEQLEAVVKHLEAVLKKKQEEMMREPARQPNKYEINKQSEQMTQLGDTDERIIPLVSATKDSFIVNEMGDIDERMRTNAHLPNDSWNSNFENAFGFDPRQIPYQKSSTNVPAVQDRESNICGDVIKEVPMDIDSDSESNSLKEASSVETNTESSLIEKQGRKVSLSDYKARRKHNSPIRARIDAIKQISETTSDKSVQSRETVPQIHQKVNVPYSQYLTEDQAKSFQIPYQLDRKKYSESEGHLQSSVNFTEVTSSLQQSSVTNVSTISGFSSQNLPNRVTNNPVKSPTAGLSPRSAGSSHIEGFFQKSPVSLSPGTPTNQPIGSILQKVNIDISNIKNILQNIAASPTTSPTVSPEKNIWSSAHEDVPWIQLKEVKRQLSYEEQQAELRYDAYNLTTSKPEKPTEDEDDADYSSLISKIKNLQQEIDQIKKDEKSNTSEWPSPLKAVKELVDKKLETNQPEPIPLQRGANLLQDLSYFREENTTKTTVTPEDRCEVIDLSSDHVEIPGFGFSDESKEKSRESFSSEESRDPQNAVQGTIDLCGEDESSVVVESPRKEISELSENPDSDDNCLVICDTQQTKASEPRETLVTNDKTNDKLMLSKKENEEHVFSLPVAMSTPTKKSRIKDKQQLELENDIGYISCDGSYTTESEISPQKTPQPPKTVPNKDIEEKTICPSPVVQSSTEIDAISEQQPKETQSKSSVSSSADISLGTNSTDTSFTDETKKKAHKAKMKAYLLKKQRGMLGYSKKRKRRKKKHTDLDDLVSTTSSDLVDISESVSLDRFSAAMSTTTRTSSPLESKPNLRTLLADLGVKHWSDGLKVKELQPTVYLKRCDDAEAVPIKPTLTRNRLESKSTELLPDVDSRFPQHKDERVKEWIEGTRKKIKLTLKDPLQTPQNASEKQSQVAGPYVSETVHVKTEVSVPLKSQQIKDERHISSFGVEAEPSNAKPAVEAKIDLNPSQGLRNISPITVVCSKPPMMIQTRVSSPLIDSKSNESSFKPITTISNIQQPATAKMDIFTPRSVRLSSSVSSSQQQLSIPLVKPVNVPQQAPPNIRPPLSKKPLTSGLPTANQPSTSQGRSITSVWPPNSNSPLPTIQQTVSVPMVSTQQKLPIHVANPLRFPPVSSVPSLSTMQTANVSLHSSIKKVPILDVPQRQTIPVHSRVPAVTQKRSTNLVQVATTYSNSQDFPPPFSYNSAPLQPFTSQSIQLPVTQPVYYNQYHPMQPQVHNHQQPRLQSPLYPNQPHPQGASFQPPHQGISLQSDHHQGMSHLSVNPVPPPQNVHSQPIHQSISSYPLHQFEQTPAAATQAMINETPAVKRKSTDVMDWFAEKFVPKKHVKESGSSSFTDNYTDTDSTSSPTSHSPNDSYSDMSLSPSPQKKRLDSFLVYGCQPEEAGRNESDTKPNEIFDKYGHEKNKSSKRDAVSTFVESRPASVDKENRSSVPGDFIATTKQLEIMQEKVEDSSKNKESSRGYLSDKHNFDKPKPGFKNTFTLVDDEIHLKQDITDTPASPEDTVRNVILETPASPEPETPASPDHVFEHHPCEVIDVSESPERHSDDSDQLDISIDGLARKREMIRKQLDDLRSSSGSPRVSRKVQLKSADLIEISDEELEEGEINERGTETKESQSATLATENRTVAIHESDDTRDKILSKYNTGLSVTVRSKETDVWDSAIILSQTDSRSVEKLAYVDSEHEVDRKGHSEKEKESYQSSKREKFSNRSHNYNSRRIRSRSRSSSSEVKYRSRRYNIKGRYRSRERSPSEERRYKSRERSSSSERRKKSRGRSASSERRKKSRGRSASRERRYRSRGRSASRNRRYKSRGRSESRDKRYKSRDHSSSSERRFRSRDRSSSSERRYRSRGRSPSSERRYRSRGRSLGGGRRYRSRDRSSSSEKRYESEKQVSNISECGDKHAKPKRNVYIENNSKDRINDHNESIIKSVEGIASKMKEYKDDVNRIPNERKNYTSKVANAWSEISMQNPTNVEVIKGETVGRVVSHGSQKDFDVDKELKIYMTQQNMNKTSTNVNRNDPNNVTAEQFKEVKNFVQKIRNTASSETLRSWAIRELKFHSESDFNEIAPKITVDLNLTISQLSKNQRKSMKAKIRKEVEVALENMRIERLGANQSFPASAAENVVKDDKNALEIRPFEPLNFTKNLIEKELEIVRDHLKRLWHSTQDLIDAPSGSSASQSAHLFSIRQDMQQIETDLVQRVTTYGAHYGVPNRRVPNELLTAEEKTSHFSEESLVLVLSGYIPSKAFQKLLSLREKLENSKKEMAKAESCKNKEQVQRLKSGKEEIHRARKAMMLSFTGPLTKKRLQKIKTKAKCYRNCVDYFKKELGEFDAETHLRYLMISLQDLDKHFSLLTQLLEEQDKQKQEEITQDIHLKKRRVMVDKFHDNFKLVDNQLNTMYAKYQYTNPHVCAAITDVSDKIRQALTLIDAEKNSKNISINTVAKLEQILKSCLSGYENVKQQIGRPV